jgi:hypothetical protein
MTELYLEDGTPATMKDIMRWWRETYPPDVFVGGPLPRIYEAMGEILDGYQYDQVKP